MITLSTDVVATSVINANVDLKNPSRTAVIWQWLPATQLTTNISAGQEIGRLRVSISGENSIFLKDQYAIGNSFIWRQTGQKNEGLIITAKTYNSGVLMGSDSNGSKLIVSKEKNTSDIVFQSEKTQSVAPGKYRGALTIIVFSS